jgi:hypothetical protein
MKVRYSVTPGEFSEALAFGRFCLSLLTDRSRQRERDAMLAKLNTALSVIADAPDSSGYADNDDDTDDDDDDTDDDGDGDGDGDESDNVTPFRPAPAPAPAPVSEPVAPPAPTEAEARAEQTRVQALHGKDMWIALVGEWRTNFMVEGAPQPDRVANLGAAANPFVTSYLRSMAGLTDATRQAIYLLDMGDPEEAHWRPLLSSRQLREARLIAENIAQVASFHAPWITEQLEYSYEFRTLPKED